jgi:hypothetical protein
VTPAEENEMKLGLVDEDGIPFVIETTNLDHTEGRDATGQMWAKQDGNISQDMSYSEVWIGPGEEAYRPRRDA